MCSLTKAKRYGLMLTYALCAPAPSPEAREVFLPDSEYARAEALDYTAMAAAQRSFSERYLSEVR
ncbi:hypothetical protein HSBAA_38490 [Vreelandella sulfidaeris]|uniref:Uncharacterized protein n=1 Tax=Vreelandella sulfidaeris TaxID=115553 RepID=A0A455UB91_9GAMM|nr:hypothetical protein HSBAA_38490 [Halomonas sulfidaeris]